MMDGDKRAWQRIAVDLPAKCRVIDGSAQYNHVRIIDMHQEGCGFEGGVQFHKDEILRMVVEIPFEGQLSMAAQAIWSGLVNDEESFRTGVKFLIDTPAAEETALKLYHYCLLRQPK